MISAGILRGNFKQTLGPSSSARFTTIYIYPMPYSGNAGKLMYVIFIAPQISAFFRRCYLRGPLVLHFGSGACIHRCLSLCVFTEICHNIYSRSCLSHKCLSQHVYAEMSVTELSATMYIHIVFCHRIVCHYMYSQLFVIEMTVTM